MSSKGLKIRGAKIEDCAILARFSAALNAADGNPTDLFTAEWAASICFGSNAKLAALIAEWDGAPAGFALFHDAINTGFAQSGVYLNDLYVDPAYRRRGLGRALIGCVAAVTRSCGRSFVWWTVKPANAEGLAFYRALGAVAEPVVSHAVAFGPFEALANEGREILS